LNLFKAYRYLFKCLHLFIFRSSHKLRSFRMKGKLIKYIGKPSKKPMFITGVPIPSQRIFISDFSLDAKAFVNMTHLNCSFSIDGKMIGDCE
jgi:hypothetical protein